MNGEMSTSRKVGGTSKRRKVSSDKKKLDPQVEQAIEQDEGMVYVFRGKKVYRRFDDEDDEEEVIDEDELGLLEHSPRGSNTKPLKTLTRRSIKPKRLFQTEAQKKARETREGEEAPTDIEEQASEVDDEESSPVSPSYEAGRSLRSTGKAHLIPSEDEVKAADGRPNQKTSPFDSWPKMKSGGGSTIGTSKGKKRGATEAIEM